MLGMMSTFRRRILFGAVAVFIVATVTTAGYFIIVRYGFPGSEEPSGRGPNAEGSDVRHGELATFASCQAIADAFKDHREALAEATELPGVFMRADGIGGGGGDTGALDYTRTNTQVEGVDEADIVKTDGTFLYILTAQRALHVLQATPPDRAQRLSTITFSSDTYPQEFFLREKTIMVFGTRFVSHQPRVGEPEQRSRFGDDKPRDLVSFAELYSLENPRAPKYLRTIEFEGVYRTSRMIDRYVYFVLAESPDAFLYDPEDGSGGTRAASSVETILPRYRDTLGTQATPAFQPVVPCSEVANPDPVTEVRFLTIAAIPIDDPAAPVTRRVIAGTGENVYASAENLYVASAHFEYSRPQNLSVVGFPIFERQETIVDKFTLAGVKVEHVAQGRVPGTVLNQFSMDEFEKTFRIATTIGNSFDERPPTNGVYVLGENLDRLGQIEDLGLGETIYSARFLGSRAYLVTFKKIDPFFVIDLRNPREPKTLGALKVPGYSDYLHPYDETHIIGIGKNAVADESGTFAWYQGMKIALFDVTDPQDPKELFKVDLGDRGTDSDALSNHKAFLFDPQRHLLALPVLLAEFTPEQKGQPERRDFEYAPATFQGSYVYELTLERGFRLLGRITHLAGSAREHPSFSYSEPSLFVKRNIRIGDNLYSISDNKVFVNALPSLDERKEVLLAP